MTEIICAGFGGQGVLTAGMMLADAGMEQGRNVSWYPSYGSEMRGGTANCNVKIGDEEIASPYCKEPDILIALNDASIDKFEASVRPGGLLLFNSSLTDAGRLFRTDIRAIGVPATEIAGSVKNERGVNIVMLGALAAVSDLFEEAYLADALDGFFAKKGKKNPLNRECFRLGAEAAAAQAEEMVGWEKPDGDEEKPLPLAGIRVLELATVVAAPTTSLMLCAYGADVIKAEPLSGDDMRLAGRAEFTPCEPERNPLFTVHNSNKKLISLDFKTPGGRKVLERLLEDTDVFITNIRDQSLKRNALDYDSLKERYPRLIYAQFSGYGLKGPAAGKTGFDTTGFWLRSGPMADWTPEGAFPFNPTYAFGDMATSSVLLSGILMALIGREKTGKGTKVDTSLFASGIWCNSIAVVSTQFGRKMNIDPLEPCDPFDTVYRCKDGRWIGLYINEYARDKEKFARLLGLDDLIGDPGFETIDALHESGLIRKAVARCNEIFLQKTAAEWEEILSAQSIACEIMRSSREVSSDPQALENGYVEKMDFGGGMELMMPCPPVFFSSYARRKLRSAGTLGCDTAAVLEEIGYSGEEIRALYDAEAVR